VTSGAKAVDFSLPPPAVRYPQWLLLLLADVIGA
jgi:hypothetical protein